MKRLSRLSSSVSIRRILFTLSVLLGAGAVRAQVVNTCAQYDTVAVEGRYNVQTNYWNPGPCPGTQCLAINTNSGAFTVTGNITCSSSVGSFPSIYYGCHYGNCSPGSNLPMQVSNLQCVTSSWNFTPTDTGSWNGAYDIFLSSNGGSTPGAELMVWLDYTDNALPAGSNMGTVNIDGMNFTLWYGTTAQTYIAYLANPKTDSVANLNILDFIKDSVSRGYFSNSWYLLSIEAGIETRSEGLPFTSNSFTAWVNGGQCGGDPSSPTATPLPSTPTPTPPATSSTWRVRCGGPQYVDSRGQTWAADTAFNGGFTYQTNNAISGTSDPALYDDERAGNPFSYAFNVPPGSYQVTLKFAEVYWGSPGNRVFNASINGTQVLSNFDIVADVGGPNQADDKVFNNITPNSNGQIVVQLGPASMDDAKVSSIQVIPQPNSTPTPTPAFPAQRIHCGGPQYVDSQGQTWAADTGFNGGWAYQTNNAIAGTSDSALYDDERAGNPFTYTFSNVPPGSYQVTLKFAEVFWSGSGQRVFNASINGTQVLTNFDIAADAGGVNRADDKVFSNISPDANGQITVQLGPAGVDDAKLSAIQVLRTASAGKANPGTSAATLLQEGGPTPTPTATPTPSGRDFNVVAAPNISHGEPVRFLINLPQPSQVTLSLFTLAGEEVYQDSWQGNAGANSFLWPLQNQAHGTVASGLYLYLIRAQTGQGVETTTGKVAVIH